MRLVNLYPTLEIHTIILESVEGNKWRTNYAQSIRPEVFKYFISVRVLNTPLILNKYETHETFSAILSREEWEITPKSCFCLFSLPKLNRYLHEHRSSFWWFDHVLGK